MKFEKYLACFKEYLKEKNFSKRTIDTYRYNTEKFLHFLDEHYPRIRSLEKVTKKIVQDYQHYLMDYKNINGQHLANKSQILNGIM